MGGKLAGGSVAARPWHPWCSFQAGDQLTGSERLVRSTGSGGKPLISLSPSVEWGHSHTACRGSPEDSPLGTGFSEGLDKQLRGCPGVEEPGWDASRPPLWVTVACSVPRTSSSSASHLLALPPMRTSGPR